MTDTLDWPTGWPRTPATKRMRGDFHYWGNETVKSYSYNAPSGATTTRKVKRSVTRAQALSRVQEEVSRMGGRDLRIDTAEDKRLDGEPRANQPRDLDPGIVVRFRINGKAIVFPCDRYKSIEQNLAAVAATLDAKRAIERHGVTTLEREFEGYAALPASIQALPPLHIVLGVQEDAHPDLYRLAWRNWILKNHPDKGGDSNHFAAVKAAYEAREAP